MWKSIPNGVGVNLPKKRRITPKIRRPLGRKSRNSGDFPTDFTPDGEKTPIFRRAIADHCGRRSAIIRRCLKFFFFFFLLPTAISPSTPINISSTSSIHTHNFHSTPTIFILSIFNIFSQSSIFINLSNIMNFWKKNSRSGKGKGKGKESSSQIPNSDEANEQWMQSLLAMGSPPGQLPYGGPSPLQTPPARRLSPYFNSAGRMPSPADEVYRPTFETPASTPGDQQSEAASVSLEDFEVEETPIEPPTRSARGKAPASSAATDTGSEGRPKRVRTTYTPQESELIATCWADTSQNAERANFQTEIMFWERVAEKYRSNKTASMTDHGSEAIRRHWERLMRDCGHFNGIYSNLLMNMPSGQNEHMVRDEAIARYCGQYMTKGFKFWNIYDKLKDLPKFRTGMHEALHGKSVRTRLSGSESEGSAYPIDLTGDGPHERPEGAKKAKGRRKGKGQSSEAQSTPQLEEATYSSNVAMLTQMYTLYFTGGGTPQEKAALWKCIQSLQIKLGMEPDEPPAPPS